MSLGDLPHSPERDVMSYEFTGEQNTLIERLAGKMSFVGLISVVFGVLYLLSAVMLLGFIFQDRLPPDVVQRIPDEVRSQVPTGNYLWGVAIQTGVAGLIFMRLQATTV